MARTTVANYISVYGIATMQSCAKLQRAVSLRVAPALALSMADGKTLQGKSCDLAIGLSSMRTSCDTRRDSQQLLFWLTTTTAPSRGTTKFLQ